MAPQAEPDNRRKRKPPPNYFSRRVQTRLLVLVGAFMLVIFMMEEARKPKYYEWMWGDQLNAEDQDSAQPEVGQSELGLRGPDEEIDTRIRPPSETAPSQVPGAIGIGNDAYDEQTLSEASQRRDDPVGRAAIDAWGRMLSMLTLEQRRVLDESLLARRRGEVVPAATLPQLTSIVAALEAAFDQYVAAAREALIDNETLAEDELAAWEGVLDQLESAWESRWLPALNNLGLSRSPSDEGLAEIQAQIDELNLAAVRDNTLSPAAERKAWLRFVEELQASKPDQLKKESIGVVGFLQLYDQPEDYRGKIVTIRGQAMLGYRVTAKKNPLGVKEYCLLWLRPRGGPNTLVAVYCLDATGLPQLKHKDRDRDVTQLDHEVQVTGYFFKKWAYRARDGLRTAPQILANSVVVESSPVWGNNAEPPSSQTLTIVAIVAAIGGVGVAVVFYALNQWPSRAAQVVTRTTPTIAEIDPNQISKGVENELRELAETERFDEDASENDSASHPT